ncbi:MAG: outer membrane lipoprotein chaperone LolA [Acidobacteria bacterium]|nr:outer membrane lipoprotein chaperone LolA [Acidobacteriota bacterium]
MTLNRSCKIPPPRQGPPDRRRAAPARRFLPLARGLVCAALAAAAAPAQAGAQDASALAGAIQQRYRSVDSFKARFVQIYRSAFSEERESGTLYMKKPGKMRWEYASPTEKLFVADGRKSYFYVPRDRQVIVSDWGGEAASTPLLFLLGEGDLKRDFELEFSRDEPLLSGGDSVMRLRPKVEQAGFREVLLEVKAAGAAVVRLSVIEHSGNRNDYLLQSFQANVRIPDQKFRFQIPKGVEIIEGDR